MGLKKAATQGAKEFAKGKAKDFITGKGKKKKKGKGGGGNYTGGGDAGDITLSGSSAIVPTTPIIPGALARPEDVEYKESDRPVTLDSIAAQLKKIVGLTETLEKIVKKQYKSKKKATEKARVAKDKKKKQEREEKQENRILGGVSAVGRRISNQFNLVNFFTQLMLGTLAIFLVKNVDKIVGALKFTQENLSLVLKSIFSLFKGFGLLKPKLLKAIKSGKESLSKLGKPVTNAFKLVGNGIKRLFKGIGDIIPNIIRGATNFITGAGKGAKTGAKVTKSAIQRYAQRYGKKAAQSRFGKTAVQAAVGKGAVGKTLDSAKKGIQRGAKKVSVGATRGVQSIAKKFGMSAKFAKKLRIPVIGPLITAVASLLSGEPIQQALFKASGAALGGILGTLIPIPVVGTLIGELIGEYFGDLVYTLFMGGGPEAAGEKLKKDITAALSMGETALRWAGDGFERFYEGIPKFKLPDLGWGNAAAYGPINLLLGATTGKKIQDVEIPNPLWMVNPTNITDKLGIFYRAFFTRDAMDGSNTKEAEVESSEESTGSQSQQTTPIQTQTPVMDGAPRTPTILGDGAVDSGLVTGPKGQIGAGDEYHIDTKFSKDLPIKQRVAMVDQMARGYAAKGRKMEFSNPNVAGEVWNPNASMEDKIELYNRVTAAHSHSVHSQYDSLDYYNPAIDETRFDSSVEGAEILMPTVEGGSLEYGTGGGYGAHAVITDESGKVVAKTGHGDARSALSGTVQFDDMKDQTIGDQPPQNNPDPIPSPSSPPISPPRQQPTADIERQASYDQPSGGNTMVLSPPQQQSSPQGRSSGGGSVMGPSTGEVLNSYYKRQLLGFLYKQG